MRMLAGVALAAALAAPAHASGPVAAAVCPPPAPVMGPHPDARHVVVLATATADTVQAGWGDVNLGRGQRRPRRWRRMQVYGQVARAARVAGPGADGLSPGPVVLVPWYPGCGGTYRWYRSFAWMRPGAPGAVVGRLRRPEDWVGGVPTVDVLRPDLVKESGELPGAVRWTSTPGELFEFYATIPTAGRLEADPWGSVQAMRAWLVANPDLRRDFPIRYAARGIHSTAAHASVRAAPSPLAGTYRFEVSRTGGRTHTIYVRTGRTARGALWDDDTTAAVPPAAAPGYTLSASARRRSSALPSPWPGVLARLWRRTTGEGDEAEFEVQLPETRAADGSRRFRGHLELVNVTHQLFADDPELREWIHEWFERWFGNMQTKNPVAEIVLRPDGAVEWSEVLEVAPDRAVTIRGVRVSEVAVETPPSR